MDTKLKSITRNSFTKLLAFILVIILITASVVQVAYVLLMGYHPETIIVSDYSASRSKFRYEMNNAIHDTLRLMAEQAIEINVEDGGNSSTIVIETPTMEIKEDNLTNEETPTVDEGDNPSSVNDQDIETNETEVLEGDYDYFFYITNGKRTITNREGYSKVDFAKYKNTFVAYENGNINYGENVHPNIISWISADKDVTMYLAFTSGFMSQEQGKWDAAREVMIPIAKSFVVFIILGISLIIYLTVVTGRYPEDEELHFIWVDKICTELMLGVFILVALGWLFVAAYTLQYAFDGYRVDNLLSNSQGTVTYMLGVATALAFSLCGVIYLALVRKLKDKRFIKDMLTYKFFYRIFHGIFDFLKSFFDGRRFAKFPLTKSLHQRQIVFIVASFLMVFMTFVFLMAPPLMIFPVILEIVMIYWYVKYNNKSYEEINKGFDESFEEQMKSERMKINLVTNVSHDLKTPLTSIISYVDLLSKEEDLSETAKDYVNILGEKSNRLKNIVADLFDLAKSTSGDIHVDFEELDLKKLIEQTIGDMEDEIEKSTLVIKTKLPEEPVNIMSDGKKLYRVFQNAIDNALKYSLKGTRIFIELEEVEGKAIATIKNTAGYEMEFTSDEILQRFTRGDQSRTTEGSGLGLSIAESFTNVAGGEFKVDIDGDMFKVIITFSSH